MIISQFFGVSEVCDQNNDRVAIFAICDKKRCLVKYEKCGTLSIHVERTKTVN